MAGTDTLAPLWTLARSVWASSDPVFHAALPAEDVVPPIERMPSSFAALATSITHQQVSTAAGRAIASRAMAACGGEWSASAVLALSEEELRAAGLSRAKVRY